MLLMAAVFISGAVRAQSPAPVEERGQAMRQGQYRAGQAHRQLEQARHDAKLAEQEVLNLRDVHNAAQQQADLRKRELEAAQKAFAAARGRLVEAQKVYDSEVDAVNRSAPPAAGK